MGKAFECEYNRHQITLIIQLFYCIYLSILTAKLYLSILDSFYNFIRHMDKIRIQKKLLKLERYMLQKSTIQKDRLILPQLRHQSSHSHRHIDFNKYYITPSLRYKTKIENPKQNPENYQDETYIYRNLHNNQFWDWVHPLSGSRLIPTSCKASQKVNITALERFKDYIQHRTNKRVPIIVKELLNRKL